MPSIDKDSAPFAAAEKKFADGVGKWAMIAAQSITDQGATDIARVIEALRRFLGSNVKALFTRLRQILDQLDPFGLAQTVGQFVEAGIEDLLDDLNKLLDDLLAAPGAVADAVIGAVLGIVEAIKKAFHLILDGIKLPHLTQPVELFLDLIDNVIGNIAELVSTITGKSAKTFRTNMYGQLAMIRAADAARSGVVLAEERREES